MSFRVAVLNNNTDRSDFSRRFPDDGQKVVALLQPMRPDWAFDVWQAAEGELPAEPLGYQGFVLTGSVSSVNDAAPWVLELAGLVRRLHAAKVPLVGLCFGHQMVAHALGGRVGPSPGGWRVGTAVTHYNQALPFMQPPRLQLCLHAVHEEQVLQPPAEAEVVGGDDFAPAAALRVGRHIFTTQYHPELSQPFMQALLDEFGSEWPAELVARARQQLQAGVDAALFMRWVAQFLEQGARTDERTAA